MSAPSPTQYPAFSRVLHWFMALALVAMVTLGYYMKSLSLSPTKFQLYSWHKWTGICLLAIVILRLLWRWTHRLPSMPGSMGKAGIALAHLGHMLLYAVMIAIPLTGWMMSSAKGIQTVLFGVYPLPDLIAKDKELGNALVNVHIYLNYVLIALVGTHILAALKHQFIDKDRIFSRITFSRKLEKQS